MASSWFIILLLRCINFLSWPVLALVYPLCASIEAIESGSHSETRSLISYWILLSLIYLFEYAFLWLLQWFQYWHYMKLMMVAFLVTLDFGRSAYVYDQLIRSCIYMNPQAVISRFRSWKNVFAKKEVFIVQDDKYITHNGTETFEKLLASKANTALDSLKSNESSSSAIKMAADAEHETYAHIPESGNAQKEWTCAICQMTMPSEANLNSHLQGKKHKAACEALNTKSIATVGTDEGNEEASPQVSTCKNVPKIWTCEICQWTMFESNLNSHLLGKKHKAASEALISMKTKGTAGTDTGNEAPPHISASTNVRKFWTCDICQLTMSEGSTISHLQGKKHKATCEARKVKSQLDA